MKLLVDAPLPPRLAVMLRGLGHDAVHVRDVGLQSTSDTESWRRRVAKPASS